MAPTSTPLPPAQLRSPLVLPFDIPDMGPRAEVTAAAVTVRTYPGTAYDAELVLAAGSELLLKNGPVAADGYDWYEAYFAGGDDPSYPSGYGIGWVAAGPSGKAPTLIRIAAPSCPPVPVTIALLGTMTELARTACVGPGTLQLSGMVLVCMDGPITPYVYTPAWLQFSCFNAIEVGTTASVALFFPPSLAVPTGLALGDLVRIDGHLLDPAAEACRLAPDDPTASYPSLAIDQQLYRLACRSAFVLSAIEVIGHLNRPDPFGF